MPLYRPWFLRMGEYQSEPFLSEQSCQMHFNSSVYFSLTWCLERKIPVGKKPVSLSSPPLAGEVQRSFSGDDKLIPPPYRALPAQRAPEAFQPPRNSQEFSPSLQTGNWSVCHCRVGSYGPGCHVLTHPVFLFSFFFPLNFSWFNFFC